MREGLHTATAYCFAKRFRDTMQILAVAAAQLAPLHRRPIGPSRQPGRVLDADKAGRGQEGEASRVSAR